MDHESDDERAARLRRADSLHAAHAVAVATAAGPLVRMGNDILKVVCLLNGGAAIATILFLTGILHDRPATAIWLVVPLALFGFGLTVAGFATGWSYLAQESSARGLALRHTSWREPYVSETEASRDADARGDRLRRLAFGAVLVSMASLVLGFSASGLILVATLV